MNWKFLLPALFLPTLSAAQFTFPSQQLTNTDSISYLPYSNSRAIVASGQSIHIVFTDRRDGAGEVFYKRSLDGGMNWEPDVRLTTDDNIFSGRATIAAWNSEIHVVWADRRDGNYELYYKRSVNNGNTWSNDSRLTNNASNSEYPSLSVEFQSLHLTWNDDRNGQDEVYYKRSMNGGLSWTSDIRLTDNIGDSFKPSVATSDTLIHVLWEDLRNGKSEIFYKHSTDNGMTWSNDVKMSNSSADCYTPCISANGTIVYTTWDDHRTTQTEVYGRRSIDGGDTWGNETNLSNTSGDSYNAYHTFWGTFLFMTFTEEHNNDADIYSRVSTDAGLSWNNFVGAINTNFSSSDQAFVAISGAAVHVVYQDDYFGNFDIHYTRNPNGNPFPHQHTAVWGHQINSSQTDVANSMTFDAQGNAYVAGSFSGTVDFDPGSDMHPLISEGSTDAFVYKTDHKGELVWAQRIGGPETDNGYDMTLDREGNIILTGSFHSIVDFDPGPNESTLGSFGQEDVFVLKLDPNGNFIWAQRVGGSKRDEPQGIAVDENNHIYITGYYSETADFDPGPNIMNLISQGEEDIFIFSLTDQGELAWAKTIGGSYVDAARSIAVNANAVVVTGGFRDIADFDPGAAQQVLTSFGENDIFILQMNREGAFNWVSQFGNSGEDEGKAVIMDLTGNVFATGFYSDAINSSNEEDMIVYALDPSGSSRWSKRTVNNGLDAGVAIAMQGDHVYVAGTFENVVDFDLGSKEIYLSSTGNSDIVVQQIDADNGTLRWLNQFGGPNQDIACDIALAPYGKIGVTGYFNGIADFSPSIDQMRFVSSGGRDGFVTLFRECEPSYATLSITACSDYIFNEYFSFSESGTYTILTESTSGCDSIITLELTILEEPHTLLTVTGCDSYTTPSGQHTWWETGDYIETAVATNGCDSIIHYQITISDSTTTHLAISACEMYTDNEGNNYTISGTYTKEYFSSAGCDSVVILTLTLNVGTIGSVNVEACDSYTTPEGGQTWTQSGVYTYVVSNAAGCDSTITVNLLISKWDTTITQTGASLSAVTQLVNYQWLDCNAGFAQIPGETNQTFTATANGVYAVALEAAGCADTSSCYQVEIVGLERPGMLQEAILYPNPTKDYLHIQLPVSVGHVDVTVMDIQGRTLWKKRLENIMPAIISLPTAPGIYMITLVFNQYAITLRAMKI